jgi:membrane-associated phospholipid phosphatase
LFVVVAVLDRLRPVAIWNDGISGWLQGPPEQALTVIGFFTDWLFSGQLVVALGLLLCIVLALRGQWLLAASVALVFPVIFLEAVLKFLINQPPASTFLQVRVLFRSSDPQVAPLEHGFPSGHASRIGFVLGWLMLLLVPRRYRLPVLLVAVPLMLFVAWTRIYVGDHSLLEIVAGLLLAATFLPLAAALMRLSRPRPGQ